VPQGVADQRGHREEHGGDIVEDSSPMLQKMSSGVADVSYCRSTLSRQEGSDKEEEFVRQDIETPRVCRKWTEMTEERL
jgi:hypothetical protein